MRVYCLLGAEALGSFPREDAHCPAERCRALPLLMGEWKGEGWKVGGAKAESHLGAARETIP